MNINPLTINGFTFKVLNFDASIENRRYEATNGTIVWTSKNLATLVKKAKKFVQAVDSDCR